MAYKRAHNTFRGDIKSFISMLFEMPVQFTLRSGLRQDTRINFETMTTRFIVFFFTLILPTLAWTQDADFAALFKQGTQHYAAKEYDKSRDAFAKALEKDPHNATTLTNLALAQFQLGQKPLSIGLFRKALTIDPELKPAQAGLKFALTQMEIKEIPHQIETYESVRAKLLAPVSLTVYLIITALLLFAAGWILIGFMGQRRRALAEEKASPGFPVIGTILGVGFLFSATLLGLKFFDQSIIRATIVEDKVSLQSAPGDNQVALLDLYGGMEVIVQNDNNEWAQVTYPGSITGWVKKSAILRTN
ncbi:tetratricopeptide repeat protein [Bdellovibrio sp. HCB209]|uniref:tetratricopeptide repeat protein n=1 Tax=Bdellovibrio sp. HCB209 TaxID=3394354 RepID=UPI0039B48A1E